MRILLIGVCLAGVTLAGFGDVHRAAAASAARAHLAAPLSPTGTINVTVSSPTHKPKVNVPWPVKVRGSGVSPPAMSRGREERSVPGISSRTLQARGSGVVGTSRRRARTGSSAVTVRICGGGSGIPAVLTTVVPDP
jgi:hypothetical protein